MTEVFAYYFPQLYQTVENSAWWGEGFTDWQLVKQAMPLFEGHQQPRIPEMGYLDQSEHATLAKQVALAREYSVTGFNFYHYWFNGKVYLEKPAENFLNDKNLNLKIMFTWANESWTRQWIGKPTDFLIKQKYYRNIADIERHYNYLSPFFKDKRYYKVNNKPVFSIYRPELIPDLNGFIATLKRLAIEDGFAGIFLIACRSYQLADAYKYYCRFDGIINFNPRYAINTSLKNKRLSFLESVARKFPESVQSFLSKRMHKNSKEKIYAYGAYLASMEHAENEYENIPVYHSVFPDWDNTARYKERATLFRDISLEGYEKALKISYDGLTKQHQKIIFINAWNEWSEGAYLEPDTYTGLNYLKITKSIQEFV